MQLVKNNLLLIAAIAMAVAVLPAAVPAQKIVTEPVYDRTGSIVIRNLDEPVLLVKPDQDLPPIRPNSTIEMVNKCATFAPAQGFLQIVVRGCVEFTAATEVTEVIEDGEEEKEEVAGGTIVAIVTVQAGESARVCARRGPNSCHVMVESLKGDIRVVMADTDALLQTGVKAELGLDCYTSLVDIHALVGKVTGLVCKTIECEEGETITVEPSYIRKLDDDDGEDEDGEPEEPENPEGSPYRP